MNFLFLVNEILFFLKAVTAFCFPSSIEDGEEIKITAAVLVFSFPVKNEKKRGTWQQVIGLDLFKQKVWASTYVSSFKTGSVLNVDISAGPVTFCFLPAWHRRWKGKISQAPGPSCPCL